MRPARRIWVLVALAALLRLWNLGQGLPDFSDEAIPFRRALEMWGWDSGHVDWNPHLFHYPSLSFEFHFILQNLHFLLGRMLGWFGNRSDYYVSYLCDPTPMVLVARLLGVASEVAIVVAVARIGERWRAGAGLLAVALVACSPLMILDARTIGTDGLMTALAFWALERALAYHAAGRRSQWLASAVLIGLAAGAKYPAAALLLVLGWTIWDRDRARALGAWLLAVAIALAVFLASSPFIVLDFPSFYRDFSDVGHLAGHGHLGHLAGSAFPYYLASAAHYLGWPALVMTLASLALVFGWPRREPVATALWLTLLVLGGPLSLGRIEAERYLLPILPTLALLASIALHTAIERLPRRVRRIAGAVAFAGILAPPVISGVLAAASGEDTTQQQARRWLEAHLSSSDLLIQEPYGAQLLTRREIETQAARAAFGAASSALQERWLARRTFRSVEIPLAVAGRLAVQVPLVGGGSAEAEVTPEFADVNAAFYDPRLLSGVNYLVTSAAVSDRYRADTLRYARQAEVYRALETRGTNVARFGSDSRVSGPELRIYRLDERAWSEIRGRYGRLDPNWWSEFVPERFRTRVDGMSVDLARLSPAPVLDSTGRTSLWQTSLQPFFEARMGTFVFDLASHLIDLGRWDDALPLTRAMVRELPGNVRATGMYVTCAERMGDWQGVGRELGRMLELLDPDALRMPEARLEYAAALERTGEETQAALELQRVLAAPGLDPKIGVAARRMLAALPGARR